VVAFLQQARLLEQTMTDADDLVSYLSQNGKVARDGETYAAELISHDDAEVVVRTIETKTGLAATHRIRRATLGAHEYHRLAEIHRELVTVAGSPPFVVKLRDNSTDAQTFEELRDAVLAVAQKGIDYYRFKGLGEMDPDELRETTMDPATRTLVRVTLEDAASADDVFSMLMGDQVEPRREFIEDNALAATIDV
jgi:DNA gyrase subunit B